MPRVIIPSFTVLSVIRPECHHAQCLYDVRQYGEVIVRSVIMLSVSMLSVSIMKITVLSVAIISVVMTSVVAPTFEQTGMDEYD
jgi:hypothetical protein